MPDDPTVTDPGLYRVVFENDRVRVLEYRDRPGDRTHRHGHPDSVMVTLTTFRRRLHGDDRQVDVDLHAGQVRWLDAQEHAGENIGPTDSHSIFVELKQAPPPALRRLTVRWVPQPSTQRTGPVLPLRAVAGGYAWWMTEYGPGVVKVRAARPEEAEAVLGIQHAASVAAFRHIFPPTRYPFPAGPVRERWQAALGAPEGRVLVAERDGLPVGVVQVACERLDGLFVLPCAWGGGVADRLHDAAVQALRAWGCGCCRLSVLEENHRARRFYERRGWRLDGRRTRTPFPPHPPMVGYSLTLGAAPAAGSPPGTQATD